MTFYTHAFKTEIVFVHIIQQSIPDLGRSATGAAKTGGILRDVREQRFPIYRGLVLDTAVHVELSDV